MKRCIKIFFFLLFGILQTYCQNINNFDAGNNNTLNLKFYNLSDHKYEVLSGSPYQKSEFTDGEILLWKGRWQKGYSLRLNTYTQHLEFKEKNSIKAAIPELIQGFKIDSLEYRTGFQPIDKNNSTSFYQIIYDGKVKLLKYTNTIMKEVKAADDVKLGDEFNSYDYYYLYENEKLTKFLLGKKGFLKVISEKKLSKVEKYVDEKKLKMKEVADYIEVIKYYESML